MKRQVIIALILVLSLTACGDSSSGEIKDEQETTMQEEESEEETEEEAETEYQWDARELSYLGMTRDELLTIYDDYMDELADESGWDLEGDEYQQWEDDIAEKIAVKYEISTEDLNNIFIYSSTPNYYATFNVDDVKLKYGDLESLMVNGGTIVIEAKITPSLTNNMTIDQNYYTVTDFIKKYIGDEYYDDIVYWAVADMTSGNEGKCISFTVPHWVIDAVASGNFIDTQLGDYADDLWILPSLLD